MANAGLPEAGRHGDHVPRRGAGRPDALPRRGDPARPAGHHRGGRRRGRGPARTWPSTASAQLVDGGSDALQRFHERAAALVAPVGRRAGRRSGRPDRWRRPRQTGEQLAALLAGSCRAPGATAGCTCSRRRREDRRYGCCGALGVIQPATAAILGGPVARARRARSDRLVAHRRGAGRATGSVPSAWSTAPASATHTGGQPAAGRGGPSGRPAVGQQDHRHRRPGAPSTGARDGDRSTATEEHGARARRRAPARPRQQDGGVLQPGRVVSPQAASTEVGARRAAVRARQVAVLDVERPGGRLALEVGVDLGDHRPGATAGVVEHGVQGGRVARETQSPWSRSPTRSRYPRRGTAMVPPATGAARPAARRLPQQVAEARPPGPAHRAATPCRASRARSASTTGLGAGRPRASAWATATDTIEAPAAAPPTTVISGLGIAGGSARCASSPGGQEINRRIRRSIRGWAGGLRTCGSPRAPRMVRHEMA